MKQNHHVPASRVRLLLAIAGLTTACGSCVAEDIYWVGYQNGCMVDYPQNASFFHGDNWWNYVVPGPGDIVLMGTGFDPGGGGIPRTIHFGDFCVDVFACPSPIFLPGGTARSERLVIQDGAYTFDFGPGETGSTSCDPRPSQNGGYEIVGQDVAPLVVGDIVQTTGQPGNASLTLQGDGTLTTHFGYIGLRAGTSGELVVRDDAALELSWFLDVGSFGLGEMRVQGGSVFAPILIIARDTTGEMIVSNGATVDLASDEYLPRASIGLEAGSSGSIEVAGQGTTMTIDGQSRVGLIGTGEIVVRDGARFTVAGQSEFGPHGTYGLSILGRELGSRGTIRLSQDASWMQIGQIGLGRRGAGDVTIDSGARMELRDWPGSATAWSGMFLGENLGSTGRLDLSGAGSQLDIEGRLWIGMHGEGQMSILSGADMLVRGNSRVPGVAILGAAPDGVGRLEVSNTDTRIVLEGQFTIGREGRGDMAVTDGAIVRVQSDPGWADSALTVVGAELGSRGSLELSGPGTTWTSDAQIQVGNGGSGLLEVREGAVLHTMKFGSPTGSSGIVSGSGGGPGLAILDGAGTAWTQDGALAVGFGGRGELQLTNGALVHSAEGRLANNASSEGLATIDGAGSSWLVDGAMSVGYSGAGTMRITGGGLVHSDGGFVSLLGASVATAEIAGADSRWRVDSDLFVGGNASRASIGSASLVLLDGGSVDAGGDVRFWPNATLEATLPNDIVPLSAGGTVHAAGQLSIRFEDGYQPSIGDRHRVVMANAIDSTFEAVDLPGVPSGMAVRVLYEPGAVIVAVLCSADIDGDGQLTIFDFLAFQNAFDAMDPVADFDGDEEFTIFDFLAFQNEFDAGCP